eukprot:TRINITY_DN16154_c0_g1_i2.p1 TRINITY_DN16154_c0_g1~~TRINITY_DN16154_c0_g1_i2.p1  ORF type:complete len:759 (-),score=131.47 TRINITY_DN16154_c0_g1_i2:56-2332(-)
MLRLRIVALIASYSVGAAVEIATGSDNVTTGDPSCPVQLLRVSKADTDSEEVVFVLSERGIGYLEKQRSPLYFVPLLGVYRGGKSLVLNRCMGLQAPYPNGFGVGHAQDTHTRGIDVCAEFDQDLGGTIVWMDTEGLFSSEFARGDYGPKMFSMALLFSSLVMLNSVKVLNDQFFSFFGEQLQVARVLRQGLVAEGLPENALLPQNTSLVWIVQQPISYGTESDEQLTGQLHKFLHAGNDEGRQHVRGEFSHQLHVVPAATNDQRLWSRLDTVIESELAPEYVASVSQLRNRISTLLRSARSVPVESVRGSLRMYADLVQSEKFSGKLTREAFETDELARRCANFSHRVQELVGEALPSPSLTGAIENARSEVEPDAAAAAENFHFSDAWLKRVRLCIDQKVAELEAETDRLLLDSWEDQAREISEGGACFFLSDLVASRDKIWKHHNRELHKGVDDASIKFARSLQRARLVECLKVKDFLWPLLPGLAWPVISVYLRRDTNVFASLLQLAIHVVIVVGAYAVAGSMRKLPPYLDLDYPVLQARPMLLDTVVHIMPWMPWAQLADGFGAAGLCFTLLKTVRALVQRWKPAGDAVGGMLVLEQKVNILMERTRLTLEQQLLECLQDAYCSSTRDDERSTTLSLFRVLCFIRSIKRQDAKLDDMADADVRQRAEKLLTGGTNNNFLVCKDLANSDALELALTGRWSDSLKRVVEILEVGSGKAPLLPELSSGELTESVDRNSGEVARRRGFGLLKRQVRS